MMVLLIHTNSHSRADHPMEKSMAVLGAWHRHHINKAQEPAIAEARCGQVLVLKAKRWVYILHYCVSEILQSLNI